jgi:DNA-binding transcriptional LysR family regulator
MPMTATDDFDWDDLRYFLRALQAKTLAGAARGLGVEHSTIGRRLSALERSLGAPLLLRGPEGVQATPLGKQLLPLVEEMERTALAVHELVMVQKARVRLAVPSGFTALLTPLLSELRRDHPNLTLEVLSGSRPANLEKGEADLAIRVGPQECQELVSRKLCVAGWSLYASRAYLARRPSPIELEDLSGHDLIGYDASLAGLPAVEWLEQRMGTASVVLRSREMIDMLAAAVNGIGLAVLPCYLGDSEARLVRLTPEVVATRNLALVYRREARQSEAVRAVMRFVIAIIPRNAALISGARAACAALVSGPGTRAGARNQ